MLHQLSALSPMEKRLQHPEFDQLAVLEVASNALAEGAVGQPLE